MLRNTHIAQERFGPHEDWFLSRGEREKQATPILQTELRKLRSMEKGGKSFTQSHFSLPLQRLLI